MLNGKKNIYFKYIMPRSIKMYNKNKNNNKNNSTLTTSPPPPKEINNTNPSSRDGLTNTFTSNIISGFAFGAGSSFARNVVDGLFNNKTESSNNIKIDEKKIFNNYNNCLKNNNEEFCKDFYTDSYKTDTK
jgi:hypothetical protein